MKYRQLLQSAKKLLNRRVTDNDGFSLLSITLIMSLVFTYMVLMLDSQMALNRSMKLFEQSLSAQQIAEAGMHKAIHCIRSVMDASCPAYGLSYSGETGTAFGDGNFSVSVSGDELTRSVTSIGMAANGRVFTLASEITIEPTNISTPGFDNSIQAGDLGAVIENNAGVTGGPIRSAADVECNNNSDIDHIIYVTSSGGMIYGCDDLAEAHADIISNSEVDGDAYYRSEDDIIKTKVHGSAYPGSPTPEELPMPDLDLGLWREVAAKGGVINGDYEPGDGSELGPIRINGDLTLGNGVDVTVTGPIWVNGDILISQNASISLHWAYGSTSSVILADSLTDPAGSGFISIENNVSLAGSGTDGSYLLIISTNNSTSDTDPAISVANNAAEAIFYAPNGTVRLQNNSGAVAAVGRRVYLDQNADVSYDDTGATPSDMDNATSSAGTWLIRPGTWREIK